MKLKNRVISNAIVAITGVANGEQVRQPLATFKIKETKANYNIGRTLKYLKVSAEKIDGERIEIAKSCFGDEKGVTSKHPKWDEFAKAYEEMMNEETDVEKVFTVTLDQLEVVKDTPAVPSETMEALDFMITEPKEETDEK